MQIHDIYRMTYTYLRMRNNFCVFLNFVFVMLHPKPSVSAVSRSIIKKPTLGWEPTREFLLGIGQSCMGARFLGLCGSCRRWLLLNSLSLSLLSQSMQNKKIRGLQPIGGDLQKPLHSWIISGGSAFHRPPQVS